MEMMLRLLKPRNILTATVFLAAVAFALRFGHSTLERIEFWLHPPAAVFSPLAADLIKDADARQSAHLRGLHRAVNAELRAARSKGADVVALQLLADSALTLDVPGYRSSAIERLNKLRAAIPRIKSVTRPASNED